MSHERSIARYRNLYARLLRLYSMPYYERFVARQKHSGDSAVDYAGRVAAADAQVA
jgi:hypothetical protein